MDLSYLTQADYPLSKWDNMFFSEAALWSMMSHDVETQCGCVLVKNKSTISTGYNGFIRDIDDLAFPNTRPEKYPFMIHAEANAVYNAVREGKSTAGATAYITAKPCIQCLQMLWQCGITDIYISDLSSPKDCFYGENYLRILEQISDRVSIYFIPKYKLNTVFLQKAIKKFEKNRETD